MAPPKPKTFRATLEHLRGNLGWVIIRIPFDVKKTWGNARIKVKGEVNGVAFRTSLFPVGSSRVDLQACKLEYSIVSPK